MPTIFYTLVKFYIIVHLTANFARCKEDIHVSRFGNDSTICGRKSSPCRTIAYAIREVSEGSIIYLDGSNTKKDPYVCQSVDPEFPGIYLAKSVSFVGIRSRAYISCRNGNVWFVDGDELQHKDGLRVSFHGLAFQNTSLYFIDALVKINDSLFEDSRDVAITVSVVSLARFELSLNNVVFQRNVACMMIDSYTRTMIFIKISNSNFTRNTNNDSTPGAFPSILLLNSKENDINIQLQNCSFQKNLFQRYGMILVRNTKGTTNILLHQFKFDKNGHDSTLSEIPNGIFFLESTRVVMTLEFGSIYCTFGTFVSVYCHLAQVNIFHVNVDKFESPDLGGGVFNINGNISGSISIRDSCFRNGKSNWIGGIASIIAPNLTISIDNCTFHNISSRLTGGAVYVRSHDSMLNNRPNISDFVVELNITNSSFSNCTSNRGGALLVFAEALFATITDTFFERNNANTTGGALMFNTLDIAIICLRNVHFIENIAGDVGIVAAAAPIKDSTFIFTTNEVSFLRNELRGQQPHNSGILFLWIQCKISRLVFKSTRVIRNIGVGSTSIGVVLSDSTTFHSVTLDTCIFRENIANIGSFLVEGQGTLVCKHSVFDSNGGLACVQGYALSANMSNSQITINNSTFINNSCGAAFLVINRNSHVKIRHSRFVRNQAISAAGGALYISAFTSNNNDLKQTHVKRSRNFHQNNALMENVFFQENIANTGAVLVVTDCNIKLLNCIFENNFARFHGGQIESFISANVNIYDCAFKQTIPKIIINKTEFITSSFLRIYSTGELLLRNTIVDLNTISDDPLIFATGADRINIDKSSAIMCPVGSALKESSDIYRSATQLVHVLDVFCKPCDYNFYSLQRGHTDDGTIDESFMCMPCPRGADCLPTVKSKPNFWGYNASLDPPHLVFTLCPFGYCKSPQANSSKYNDCQGKRTGVMCGSCSEGYTEALWSTHCTPLENCNDYWFWSLFLILVLFTAIVLVFKPSFITFSLKHVFWLKRLSSYALKTQRFGSQEENGQANMPLSSKQQLKQDKGQFSPFLEIIFYFYQIAQLFLSSYSLSVFFKTNILPTVLGFFNFEPRLHKRGFLCPFPGLTPKTKLAFKILPVFGTMLAIFTMYFFHIFFNKIRRSPRPSVSPYLQASIKTIFLGYTTLATVGISLIRCVPVAGEDRWFYNGNVICYQWWQYVSFAFNGIFVIPLIFVLAWASFKLHHGTITSKQFLLAIVFPLPFLLSWLFRIVCPSEAVNIEESEKFCAMKEMLLGPYKEPGNRSKYGAMYWQSVLIARRLVLVLIFCTITEPSIRLFCMTLACVFVLFFHLKVKPYRNALANNFESLSLLLLIVLGLINLLKSVFVGFEGIIKGPLVTVFKVFQWLEVVILGLFPALLSLIVCFAIISLIFRVLFMCCRSLFKCIFRRCAQRSPSQDTGRLINICEDINVD